MVWLFCFFVSDSDLLSVGFDTFVIFLSFLVSMFVDLCFIQGSVASVILWFFGSACAWLPSFPGNDKSATVNCFGFGELFIVLPGCNVICFAVFLSASCFPISGTFLCDLFDPSYFCVGRLIGFVGSGGLDVPVDNWNFCTGRLTGFVGFGGYDVLVGGLGFCTGCSTGFVGSGGFDASVDNRGFCASRMSGLVGSGGICVFVDDWDPG